MKRLATNRKLNKKDWFDKNQRSFSLRQQYIVDWKTAESLAQAKKQRKDKERNEKKQEKILASERKVAEIEQKI